MSDQADKSPTVLRCQLLVADHFGPCDPPSSVRAGGRMERCGVVTDLVEPLSYDTAIGICAEHATSTGRVQRVMARAAFHATARAHRP